MGILSRRIFLEIAGSAGIGATLFVFVLFLQKAGQLFSILVNSTTTAGNVGYMFLLLLPATMPLTLPLGTLVGVLIALSRMSSDSEIIAMRAAGVPARQVVWPVSVFALLAMAATAYCSLWLTPWCNAEIIRVVNRMGAAQLTAEIQPRIFEESFPRTVLHVGDVRAGQPVKWTGTVFMADLTPPEDRAGGGDDKGDAPRITIAPEAVVTADGLHNRLQMSIPQGVTYEVGEEPGDYNVIRFKTLEQELAARARGEEKAKLHTATPTLELVEEARKSTEAAIELHQRFALPLACVLLASLGIPLGVSSRKGGKSAAFVVTVALAFLYYMALITLVGLARDSRIGPALAVWMPNAVFAIASIVLLARLERPGDRGVLGWAYSFLASHVERFRRWAEAAQGSVPAGKTRFFFLPQVIDTYVLSNFFFYFAVTLISFVTLIEIFNFFELLGDAFRNAIPMNEMLQYLFFLAPMLIYDATPISVLVAVLVTFGMLTKSNEITALKACGVSLYRVSMPVILTCFVFSGALFAFDFYVVTNANLVQDRLRNKIKGNPPKTYLSPNRQWIRGEGADLRIYYYKYFNAEEGLLGNVHVYEIDEKTSTMKRHVYAGRARWEPTLKTWIFQDGWARELGDKRDNFRDFRGGAMTFPELAESPSWFAKEVKTYKQMNYLQLGSYIEELEASGFNATPLEVQYYRKFSVPLFVLVMSMLSVPFAFLTGSRGAMTGVGVSLGVAIAYFASNSLFEQLGNVKQLMPIAAAWAPGALFALTGTYLMTRMKT